MNTTFITNLIMKLHDFIVTMPCLNSEDCTALRYYFDNNPEHHVIRDNNIQSFTEMNLNEYEPQLGQFFGRKIKKLVEKYQDLHCPTGDRFFPQFYGLEEFRIKRYNTDGDSFKQHVDVGDLNSSRRFLAFLFYLNDDYEGGGTLFKTPDPKYIKPKQGDVLVFPPTWQYPHEGMAVTKAPKYIMSTYLHYVAPPPGTHDTTGTNQ